jgi:hypothetical protein
MHNAFEAMDTAVSASNSHSVSRLKKVKVSVALNRARS